MLSVARVNVKIPVNTRSIIHTQRQSLKVFKTFDVDDSGFLEFDEFYLLICMLVAVKVNFMLLCLFLCLFRSVDQQRPPFNVENN